MPPYFTGVTTAWCAKHPRPMDKHHKISVGALKQIETGGGNPKVETLNKIADIFGLEVGFIRKKPR